MDMDREGREDRWEDDRMDIDGHGWGWKRKKAMGLCQWWLR